jgi:cytoplasmic iron level regulating protein YaaA (DUF328/UPF0246 family)
MKILLSPAKSLASKTASCDGLFYSQASFLKESKLLVSKLKKMNAQQIQSMMHLSKDLAALNVHRFQKWEEPIMPTEEVMQAVFAFNGEVYRGFDASGLSIAELERAQTSVRILSGLYGILKPMDLIYPYRLEMGTKWEIGTKHKNLYQFWGKKLAQFLNNELEPAEYVINLASAEYSKAVDQKTLKARVITPVFKEFKNGKYSIVMVYAKQARGKMARHIIQENITEPEALKLYGLDGYSFDVNQSSDSEWVFVR